jgi:hypothetical protein
MTASHDHFDEQIGLAIRRRLRRHPRRPSPWSTYSAACCHEHTPILRQGQERRMLDDPSGHLSSFRTCRLTGASPTSKERASEFHLLTISWRVSHAQNLAGGDDGPCDDCRRCRSANLVCGWSRRIAIAKCRIVGHDFTWHRRRDGDYGFDCHHDYPRLRRSGPYHEQREWHEHGDYSGTPSRGGRHTTVVRPPKHSWRRTS